MADIAELEQWEAGVYQIETTDPVEGGPDGVDNLPHRHLANRTVWLRAQIDALAAQIATSVDAAKLNGLTATEIIAATVDQIVNGASSAMDTLAELEAFVNQLNAFISDNDTDITALTNSLAGKASLNGDAGQTFSVAPASLPEHAVQLQQLAEVGVGQTWVDETANRAIGVTYTNTTDKPIIVSVHVKTTIAGYTAVLWVDGVASSKYFFSSLYSGTQFALGTVMAIVQPGSTYAVNSYSHFSINSWVELK